jgi:hypothetical protein
MVTDDLFAPSVEKVDLETTERLENLLGRGGLWSRASEEEDTP